jgi:polysaccharide chain length determinant protein (PEP-CTERM system associated)
MEAFEIEKYKQIVVRRGWWIVIPFLISILIGIGLTLKLPRIYRASTLILIQGQKVPESYVQEIVSQDIENRLHTITQQITSWSNLESIISRFNLYKNPGRHMFMEEKIEDLRKRITVEISKSDSRRRGAGASSFQIFFTGRDPRQVATITNALASFFITENLKLREEQAVSTSEFLTEELESIRRKLLEKEEELKRYRKRFMGGLPEQLDTNLRILERIQNQIATNQENVREAENRRLLTRQQLAEAYAARKQGETPSQPVGEPENPLAPLQAQLAALEARYTEKHPDIIRLKKKIADLESKQKKTEIKEAPKPPEPAPLAETERALLNQLRETELEIQTLKQESAQLQSQMKWYQTQVENTPKREQELMSLKRDYQNIRETYNSLLNRKLEAELAVNMERKQKGEQFRIIDPAKVPVRPFKPNIQGIFLVVLAVGLGLGCGLAYLREVMDTSFKSPEEIEEALEIPVITTLPITLTTKELKRLRRKKIFMVVLVGLVFVILAAGVVSYGKGVEATLEFVKNIGGKVFR